MPDAQDINTPVFRLNPIENQVIRMHHQLAYAIEPPNATELRIGCQRSHLLTDGATKAPGIARAGLPNVTHDGTQIITGKRTPGDAISGRRHVC